MSFFDSKARAGRILSFKMLLDRGLRTNPVYTFAKSKTPLTLSGKHRWPKGDSLSSINKNFKATAGGGET